MWESADCFRYIPINKAVKWGRWRGALIKIAVKLTFHTLMGWKNFYSLFINTMPVNEEEKVDWKNYRKRAGRVWWRERLRGKGENNGKNIEQGKRHPYHHLDIFYDDFKDQQTTSCHFQAEHQGAVKLDKREASLHSKQEQRGDQRDIFRHFPTISMSPWFSQCLRSDL